MIAPFSNVLDQLVDHQSKQFQKFILAVDNKIVRPFSVLLIIGVFIRLFNHFTTKDKNK
jgi:hypothetical protein